MARHRFNRLEPEKREAILQAAGEEFAEKGFEAASINRIIERSGMSKGSVYYYFEDKADLLATAVEHSIRRILEDVGWFSVEVLGPDEFWDGVLELTHRSVDSMRRNEWWTKLAMATSRLQHEPGIEAVASRIRDVGREWWGAMIDRGQQIGVVRTDLPRDLLVEIVLSADQAGDRWMIEHWGDFSEEEVRGLVDGLVDLLRDMLAKENEGWER